MTILPRFAEPLVLLLLPLVPLLLWYWQRSGHGALRFSSIELLAGLPAGRSRRAQWGGWLLRGLGLTALILTLAGPRWPDLGSRLTTEGIAVGMVVDVSGSMSKEDFSWDNRRISRLEGVKKIFGLFVEGGQAPDGSTLPGRPQDLVSLVKFAKKPEMSCPLTLDHKALVKILSQVKPAGLIDDGTNPGDALVWSLDSLRKAPVRRKVIVFLTDGDANVDKPAMMPGQAAHLAATLDIPIYAIDANPASNTDEESVKGRKMLKFVAELTKGRYFQASDAHALAEVYAEIDRLERSRIESYEYSKFYDGFVWFGLGAVAAWSMVVLLEATWWRRIP